MHALAELRRRIRAAALQRLLPQPFTSRHLEYTIIAALDDDTSKPTPRLIDVALDSISKARTIDLSHISSLLKSSPSYPEIWPGEHYKLLAGAVRSLQPKLIVEVGTFTGMSALSMLRALPECGRIVTYDVTPWSDLLGALVCAKDFQDGRLEQRVEDLSDITVFARNAEVLRDADIIFIDGPHNVAFEEDLLAKLKTIDYSGHPLVILDDIRLLGMTGVWRRIDRPKLDMTSFGHWSGTGFIDWA